MAHKELFEYLSMVTRTCDNYNTLSIPEKQISA
jgi:hypothetical protein